LGNINPKVEIRKKPEARNLKDKLAHELFCDSGFGFRPALRDFSLRPSSFGLCPQRVREKLRAALVRKWVAVFLV
jgi:hypothetical protein